MPEILAVIMSSKDSPSRSWMHSRHEYTLSIRDLRNAIRVNRLWFEIGSRELWALQESIDWLLGVPPNRRQIYAYNIVNVSVHWQHLELYHNEYKGVIFERLANLTAQINSDYEIEHVKPYLVPSLRFFGLYCDQVLESEVFYHLARSCPYLKYLLIHSSRILATSESISRFIRHAPFLISVEVSIRGSTAGSLDVELASSLAKCSRLEILRLPWCWTESVVKQVLATEWQSWVVPFPKMKDINLLATSKAFRQLAPLIAKTRRLTLTVKDSTEDVIPHLLILKDLKSLTINYEQDTFIPTSSMMGLCTLSQLSELRLNTIPDRAPNFDVWSDLSDIGYEALALGLPNLSYLRLSAHCDISTKALELFLRHCPVLKRCDILQHLDTTELFTSPPGDLEFPQLDTLLLGVAGEGVMKSVCIFLLS